MQTVFLSSTFGDMQQERDIMQKTVIPKIKKFAKQYGKDLELCDLRWGINSLNMSEQESAIKVMEVCFDEIYHAKPFFIALLGDRYGWIPDSNVVNQMLQLQGIPFSKEKIENKSITELEILYGNLMANAAGENVLYYFRHIENPDEIYNVADRQKYFSESAADQSRMQSLKQKISDQNPAYLRTYMTRWIPEKHLLDGMDAFAEMVYSDLCDLLRRQWGENPDTSEYTRQYNEYRYYLEDRSFFDEDQSIPINLNLQSQISMMSGEWMNDSQNCEVIYEGSDSILKLFGPLLQRYSRMGYDIIPYETELSIKSRSADNLISYLTDIICRSAGLPEREEVASFSEKVRIFQETLKMADSILDHNILISVLHLDSLDKLDLISWLPSEHLDHFRIMFSVRRQIVGNQNFSNDTAAFFFQKKQLFDLKQCIPAFMKHYHKELDDNAIEALIQKTQGKSLQYLELMMYILVHLKREDYDDIQKIGVGMKAISSYLIQKIELLPDNMENLLLQILEHIRQEANPDFVDAMLGILTALPYGITLPHLKQLMKMKQIPYSTLNLSLFIQSLPSLVTETLDGCIRLNDAPYADCLRRIAVSQRRVWIPVLSRYMEMSESRCPDSFFTDQYLTVATENENTNALAVYLKAEQYSADCAIAFLQQMENNAQWLKIHPEALNYDICEWMTDVLYFVIQDRQLYSDNVFYIWEVMLDYYNGVRDNSHKSLSLGFRITWQAGEIAYISHNIERAEPLLQKAKALSEEDFRRYPNRLWKQMHGIELSQEDLHMSESLAANIGCDSKVNLATQSELDDLTAKCSWSERVRVINQYLSNIYKTRREYGKGENFDQQVEQMNRVMDSDSENQTTVEINEWMTIVKPEAFERLSSEPKKKPYAPDYRRNSAIAHSRKANDLMRREDYSGAMEELQRAEDILSEIYEDGEDALYYDLQDVCNPEMAVKQIRTECLHDLELVNQSRVRCLYYLQDEQHLPKTIRLMLDYGRQFDDQRHNQQSKDDLCMGFFLAIACGTELKCGDFDTFLTYVRSFWDMKIESVQAGLNLEREDISNMDFVNKQTLSCLQQVPEKGNNVVDFLIPVYNHSVIANAPNISINLFMLMNQMMYMAHDKNIYWEKLETVFTSAAENLAGCMLKNNQMDYLDQFTRAALNHASDYREPQSMARTIYTACKTASAFFNNDRYEEAYSFISDLLPIVDSLQGAQYSLMRIGAYNTMLAVLIESGHLKTAEEVSHSYSQALDTIDIALAASYAGISVPKLKNSLDVERVSYTYHCALLQARMGYEDLASELLNTAKSYLIKNPDIAKNNPELRKRIETVYLYGFPDTKKDNGSRNICRKLQQAIRSDLAKTMSGSADIRELDHIESMITQLCTANEYNFNADELEIMQYRLMLSRAYSKSGYKEQALKILKFLERQVEADTNTYELYAEVYNMLFFNSQDESSQRYYIQKSFSHYEYLRKKGLPYTPVNMGVVFRNYGVFLMNHNELSRAEEVIEQAIEIFKDIGQSDSSAQVNSALEELYHILKVIHLKNIERFGSN